MSASSVIVIVNWNCWEDTARCINACGHLADFEGAVLVVDNGSTDDSLKNLQAFSAGLLKALPTSSDHCISLLEQRSNDPLRFIGLFDENLLSRKISSDGLEKRGQYLIASRENKGFGAGNNIGLRIAMLDRQCTLFWCLNADAIPEPQAWAAIKAHCEKSEEPCVSGSVLLNYDRPETIQASGSKISWSTLQVSYLNSNQPVVALSALPETIRVGYPIGASLVVNRSFIERCGYFDERFFLYYEEPDLVVRLKSPAQSFVCSRSLVYHKGGQTTGGGSSLADRARLADYQYSRSRIILARKIGGKTLLLSSMMVILSLLKRLAAGRFDLAQNVIRASLEGWRCAR